MKQTPTDTIWFITQLRQRILIITIESTSGYNTVIFGKGFRSSRGDGNVQKSFKKPLGSYQSFGPEKSNHDKAGFLEPFGVKCRNITKAFTITIQTLDTLYAPTDYSLSITQRVPDATRQDRTFLKISAQNQGG